MLSEVSRSILLKGYMSNAIGGQRTGDADVTKGVVGYKVNCGFRSVQLSFTLERRGAHPSGPTRHVHPVSWDRACTDGRATRAGIAVEGRRTRR